MGTKLFFLLFLFNIFFNIVKSDSSGKVVCYYDSRAVSREGLGKFVVTDLEQAIPFCTHLVYGFASINGDTNKIEFSDERKDDRRFSEFKKRNQAIKILLSVGGGIDKENKEKYLSLLESSVGRISFINSAYAAVKNNGFDGLDLAWEFPENKPKKIRSSVGSFFHKFKNTIGITSSPVDEKLAEHTEQLTMVVRELKNAFRHDNFLLTATVLPNVNSTYYDVPAIINNLDYVVLAAFDYQTPERNKKEADYPAPIYELNERLPENNINSIVQYWLSHRAPASKLILGTPTYARAWKLLSDATQTGVPPIIDLDGPAEEGPLTKTPGLLSWPEVCIKLPNPNNLNLKDEKAPLVKVTDPSKKKGSYGYRLPNENGEFGLWIAYEDADTAANKATYVQAKGLGGMAVFDITTDDFRGTCAGEKYPILRAIKYRFN